jgi:hypothetical protein
VKLGIGNLDVVTQKICIITLIGQYTQNYFRAAKTKENLTATVKAFKNHLPQYFTLLHPHVETVSGWCKIKGLKNK